VTTIFLVRHGQASFGSQNYDQLSALGQHQSRVLGEYWSQIKFSFDAVYAGDMLRQQDTARAVLAGMQRKDLPIQTLPCFNEYAFEPILRAYLPQIAQEKPELGPLMPNIYSDHKLFQTVFGLALSKWLADAPHGNTPFESWRDFFDRCVDGLNQIAAAGHKRVVVFTSGGVISVALRTALGLDDVTTFRQNWRIYNGSVHSFHQGRSDLALLGFNNIAHLELTEQKELITYR
jgi:broad specificity phosphatase PhoE